MGRMVGRGAARVKRRALLRAAPRLSVAAALLALLAGPARAGPVCAEGVGCTDQNVFSDGLLNAEASCAGLRRLRDATDPRRIVPNLYERENREIVRRVERSKGCPE